jgi:hypothetical protein
MTIHAMDPIDDFPYKHVQLRKVFNAFKDMLRIRKELGSYDSIVMNKSGGSHLQLGIF